MKVEVIALQGFGVTKKGGRIKLPRDQAKVLVQMKLAKYAPVEVVKAAPVLPAKKGTYIRRDMVAETRVAEAPKPGNPVPAITRQSFTPRTYDDDGKA